MIRPEFKNSAIVSAPEWLIMKNGTRTMRHLPVRYGVFEHPAAGKCLIDTGYSRRIMSGRRGGFLRLYGGILKPKLTSDVLSWPLAPKRWLHWNYQTTTHMINFTSGIIWARAVWTTTHGQNSYIRPPEVTCHMSHHLSLPLPSGLR